MAYPFTVIFIRHFPTQGNQQKKYIGWTDEPILEGIKTKELYAERGQIVGSDLLRCQQTAGLLFENISYTQVENLRECSFGDWEYKTYEELKENPIYQAWIDNPRSVAPPNGESLDDMEDRVISVFYQLVEEINNPIFITHGGPIRYLLSKFIDNDKTFWEWDVPHGSKYTLRWADKKDVLEGKQCTSFWVEHLMENEHM